MAETKQYSFFEDIHSPFMGSFPMKVTLKRCNDGFVALGTSLIKTDFKTCRKPPKSRSLCSTNCLPRQALKEHQAVEHQAVESLLSLKSKNI